MNTLKSTTLAALILSVIPNSQAREFTDVKGRKLGGELVNVEAGQATIKRTQDSRLFTLPVEQFSLPDQKFMASFKPTAAKVSMDVKATKNKVGSKKQRVNLTDIEVQQWNYKVALTSKAAADLTDVEIRYWLFVKEDSGDSLKSLRLAANGSTKIATLPRAKPHEFETSSFELMRAELDANYVFTDGTRNKSKDGAGGIAIRAFKGEDEIFAWASDASLLPKATGAATTNSRSSASDQQ